MSIDMHCHILTREMCRLMHGVSRAHAPVIDEGGAPYRCGLTTSSRGRPSDLSRRTWARSTRSTWASPTRSE